jgi:hypothetical protein
MGTSVGSGSRAGVGSGDAVRMTTGIDESGRADAIGSGATLGIGGKLGTVTAVGNGMRLGIGAMAGGSVIAGNAASGEASARRVGTGASVGMTDGAASGVRDEPVHATDAMTAMTTSRRTPQLPASERASNGPADRPRT